MLSFILSSELGVFVVFCAFAFFGGALPGERIESVWSLGRANGRSYKVSSFLIRVQSSPVQSSQYSVEYLVGVGI